MLKKLRTKFVCINMIIVTAMLCVIFGMVLYFTKRNLEDQSIQMMRTAAINHLQPIRPDISSSMRQPFFSVQLSNENEIISTGGIYDLSDEIEFLEELIAITIMLEDEIGIIEEHDLRYCKVHTPFGKQLIFADITGEINTINSLIKSCLLIGFLSFFAFFIISLILARWAVKPVEKAWIQQKQFVADASHELKTPLTVITTNAEMLETSDYDEASRSRFASSILTMAQQMRGLVESLLELARIDSSAVKMELAPTDLSTLVYDATLPFEAVFFEKGLTLSTDIETGIGINASEQHIRQVIEIFLDNAQKYATVHTEVILSLKRVDKKHCRLSVQNIGESVSKEDLKNIFKRFYRVDKARSMNHSYGLGLSIAEGIVHNHHGKIWAESNNNVNTFFVQFPSL